MYKIAMIVTTMLVSLSATAELNLMELESALDQDYVTVKEQVVVHEEKAPEIFKDSDIKRKLKDGTIQKFDGDKYKIVKRQHVHRRKKVERKEVVIKRVSFKNRVSLLAGFGALGNLVERTDTQRTVETEQGLVMGLQYQRSIKQKEDYEVIIGIQAQTNKTLSGMVGIGF